MAAVRLWLLLLLLIYTAYRHGVSSNLIGSGSGDGMDLVSESVSISRPQSIQPMTTARLQMPNETVSVTPSRMVSIAMYVAMTTSAALSNTLASVAMTTVVQATPTPSSAGVQSPSIQLPITSPNPSITVQSASAISMAIETSIPGVQSSSSSEAVEATSTPILSSSVQASTSTPGISSLASTSSTFMSTSATVSSTSSLAALSSTVLSSSATLSTSVLSSSSAVSSVVTSSSGALPTSVLSTSTAVSSSVMTTPTPVPPGATTTEPPTEVTLPYPWNVVADFFATASPEELSGFGVGAGVVLILSVIVVCFCCCCICSRVRKKHPQRQYNVHDTGLTMTNHGVSSMYASNGNSHSQLIASNSSLRNAEANHYELNQNRLDADQSYERTVWETGMDSERLTGVEDDYNGPSQAHNQLSGTADDIFEESTLPELTPITYPSQIFASTSFHTGLSVDEGSGSGTHVHRLSLSGDYLPRIPGGSPSLRHPTRMGQALEKEESKSNQGSRISIPSSKASGSRPSVFSSQTSFMQNGSRTQMLSSALSNDPMLSGKHREDDTLSLPLSGRTTSPLLIINQSSLNSSFEAPTRDVPVRRNSSTAVATSHNLGVGVTDFASMTCIPNHSALGAELGTVRVPLDLDPKPESTTRRLSLNNQDLGALTTLDGGKSAAKSEPKEEVIKEETKKTEEPEKKSKSKMSRLEMLTSLRASMRKAAKRVSFKSKSKQKESMTIANEPVITEQETTPTKDNPLRRHSDNSDHTLSPTEARGAGRPRSFSDFPQLSQPNMYYPPMPHSYHHVNYPQLSQSYGFPHAPPRQVPVDNPFGRGTGHPPPPQEFSTRYPEMVTPDYSDLTTPDHAHYGNHDSVTTPDQFLQQDGSTSDEYPQTTSPNGYQPATSPTISYTSNEDRAASPKNFTEATTSDSYRPHSPTSYSNGKPLATVPERYDFSRGGYPDDLQSPDMFPPYNGDMFTSPKRRGGASDFLGMYPPPHVSMGYPMHNGYPMPHRGDIYDSGARRTSFEYGMDPMMPPSAHERRRSFDRVEPYHPHQSTYEQAPGGDFPHHWQYQHPRHGSRDYEGDGYVPTGPPSAHRDTRRQSEMSESSMNSDLSASRTRVSWNTEVIEYVRTPSDGSDFDLNQL